MAPSHAQAMTSSTPASNPEQQPPAASDVPLRPARWWQRWLEPVVSVTIIIGLLAALVAGGIAVFQSVKSDVNAAENRVHEEIRSSQGRQDKRMDELSNKIDASEVRQDKRMDELKQDNADLKAELSSKIDASEARQNKRTDELSDKIDASEARQNKRMDELKHDVADLKQDNAELKANVAAINTKLDRMLEATIPNKT